MTPSRLVVVEDDTRYRESLEMLFAHAPEFELVESFASASAFLAHLESCERIGRACDWQIIIMDLELPGTSGVEATRQIKARLPDCRVVVLTVFEESATILDAICAGADGYLLKRLSARELIAQLRAIEAGGSPLTPAVARKVLDMVRGTGQGGRQGHSPSRLDLTTREQDVLRALVEGLSYKGVAESLHVSLDTVRTHVRNIYGKLQVHNVAEAVARAVRDGLI